MTDQAKTNRSTKAALLLASLMIGLGVTEIVLRFTQPFSGYHFTVSRITDDRFVERAGRTFSDDAHGVRYSFDAEGFRTSHADAERADRTVLFIGDSFTQGFGVSDDQTFPVMTCAELGRQGIGAVCLNAGTTGFGTAHELRLLRKLLQNDRRVDAVVFQILPNNDLRDNWEDGGFALEAGKLVSVDPPHIPLTVRLRATLLDNRFANASRVVTLIANACMNNQGLDPHYDASAFELERALLRDVVDTTRHRDIPIVILVTATAWELDRKALQPYDERARLDYVAGVVQELQVPWIDSRQVARSADEHYIPGDGHFSPAGNALIGQALAVQLMPLLRR